MSKKARYLFMTFRTMSFTNDVYEPNSDEGVYCMSPQMIGAAVVVVVMIVTVLASYFGG
jgi:hypothetical protein